MNQDIWSMTPEELLAYFKGVPEYATLQYESNPGYGRPVDDGGYSGYDAYGRTKDGLNVDRISVGMQGNDQIGDAYMETPIYEGYKAQLTPVNEDGFYIAGDYDEAGNLVFANRFERDTGGWFGENIDWLAPMLIGGMAFAGAGGLGSLGAGAAAADGGLGFAAGNELAGLAAAEAGFGGSAGLAGMEAALAGGAGTAAAGAAGGGSAAPITESIGTPAAGSTGSVLGKAGSALGGVGDLLGGNGKLLGGALGALAGGLSAANAPDSTTVTQRKIVDPRLEPYLFGDGENDKGLMGMWQQNLNRPKSAALNNLFGIANNFFGGK